MANFVEQHWGCASIVLSLTIPAWPQLIKILIIVLTLYMDQVECGQYHSVALDSRGQETLLYLFHA